MHCSVCNIFDEMTNEYDEEYLHCPYCMHICVDCKKNTIVTDARLCTMCNNRYDEIYANEYGGES